MWSLEPIVGDRMFLGVEMHDWIALVTVVITSAQAVTVALITTQSRRVRNIDRRTSEIADGLNHKSATEEGEDNE